MIQERQEAISRGEDTPSDILDHILRVAEADSTLTLEYLVDEFVTFFFAGQSCFAFFFHFWEGWCKIDVEQTRLRRWRLFYQLTYFVYEE